MCLCMPQDSRLSLVFRTFTVKGLDDVELMGLGATICGASESIVAASFKFHLHHQTVFISDCF